VSISRDSARASKSGGLSPEYALLGFLSLRQSHGYELHRQLVEDLGQIWRVSLSQTYNILARLETQGAIAGEMLTQEKLPARRQFNLTAMGRARFNEWLNQPTSCSVHAIRLEFTTRLYFAASNPAMARDLIDAQVIEIQRGIARLQEMQAEIPQAQTFNRLGLGLRVRQLTSILEWLSECRDALGLK